MAAGKDRVKRIAGDGLAQARSSPSSSVRIEGRRCCLQMSPSTSTWLPINRHFAAISSCVLPFYAEGTRVLGTAVVVVGACVGKHSRIVPWGRAVGSLFPPRNPCRTLKPAATATKTHNGAKVLRDFCNGDSVRGKRVFWNARDHRIMPVWLRAQHIDCIVYTYEPVLLCTFASAGLDGIPSQSQSWS